MEKKEVIGNPLTRQGALCNRSERRGDSPRVIDNPLTCQGALCNRSKRQGDDQHAVATDNKYNHRSSTSTVQKCDYLKQSYQILTHQKLFNAYQMLFNAYERLFNALYEKLLECYEKLYKTCGNKVDLGLFVLLKHAREHVLSLRAILDNLLISITNLLKIYRNVCTQTSKYDILPNDENEPCIDAAIENENELLHTEHNYTEKQSRTSDNFVRPPSRSPNRDSVHIRKRDREPSRIPIKKLINLMSKNKKLRRKIKISIKRLIPKSSAWHNLLSTRYRKNMFERQTNGWLVWKCPCCTRKIHKPTKKHKLLKLGRTKILSTATSKCDKQRLKTSARCSLLVCGDIELNPGPLSNHMSVLTIRLARLGLKPVNIAGDGNCFFRSVSHQIYHTETHHAQIRALAIQHLINSPEHFIESNTDQSWMQYLQNMSRVGTWADHIIIQAVANSHNLRIHITESAPNFSEHTIVSSIFANEPGGNARNIYIGHLDEMHYISTTPISQTISEHLATVANSAKADKIFSNKSVINNSKSRKEYMREYMKKKRINNEFKTKENEKKKIYNRKYKQSNPEIVKQSQKTANAAYKQSNHEKLKEFQKRANAAYTQSNPQKVKETQKRANAAYKQSNPQKVKETQKRANAAYKQLNPEKLKELQKRANAAHKQSNPEKLKESQKRADVAYKQLNPEKRKETLQKANVLYRQSNLEKAKISTQKSSPMYRQLHPEKVNTSSKIAHIKYKQNHPENYKISQKTQYLKRKLAGSETDLGQALNRRKICKRNPEPQISIQEGIEMFHKDISVGPEYICTCCEQLWYKSSVTKCNPDLYKSCTREILNLCLTGLKTIDNTEWICSTCHSNLKAGKLPTCAKANKMTFPEKPDVLKHLTALEERLISPRIPFMQVCELPTGGQLSIHGKVVNVPADVNSTVSILP